MTDDSNMTADEFLATRASGREVRVVTSREEYKAALAALDWTEQGVRVDRPEEATTCAPDARATWTVTQLAPSSFDCFEPARTRPSVTVAVG